MKSKVLKIGVIAVAAIALVVGGLFFVSRLAKSDPQDIATDRAVIELEKLRNDILPECRRLHDENERLYRQNSRLSRQGDNPGESADDYERRIKAQLTIKRNDDWLRFAENQYDEAFSLFSRGEWDKCIDKSQKVQYNLDRLREINYLIKNYRF